MGVVASHPEPKVSLITASCDAASTKSCWERTPSSSRSPSPELLKAFEQINLVRRQEELRQRASIPKVPTYEGVLCQRPGTKEALERQRYYKQNPALNLPVSGKAQVAGGQAAPGGPAPRSPPNRAVWPVRRHTPDTKPA